MMLIHTEHIYDADSYRSHMTSASQLLYSRIRKRFHYFQVTLVSGMINAFSFHTVPVKPYSFLIHFLCISHE